MTIATTITVFVRSGRQSDRVSHMLKSVHSSQKSLLPFFCSLKQGFSECFRVLKPNGILVFKWNETDVPVSEIIKLLPYAPLFGNQSGKLNKTHWIVFMKNKEMELKEYG